METQLEKKPKQAKKGTSYAALRVRRELKRQIEVDLERINKKDLGRRVRAEDYLALALKLVTPQHLEELRETSLTNADRLERDFRAYVAEHGSIPRDEYLGKRLSGEIQPHSGEAPRIGNSQKTA
jgi:hypothetical protein